MAVLDETFYNIKRLHVVFAISSLMLLAVTVWMVLDDHFRQWKVYQRTYLDQVEPWFTEARIDELQNGGVAPSKEDLKRRVTAAALADHRAEVARLERVLERQRPRLAKRLLRLPLIDAFGRPLAIDQIWLPELTIDYNFRQVARFDRCVTCHQAIDKTQPGAAAEPACLAEENLIVHLATPEAPPPAGVGGENDRSKSSLEAAYGLVLAPRGILDPDAATVGLVLPETAAADARLHVGDVILSIDGAVIGSRAEAVRYLLEEVVWGEPTELKIRHGLPQPYSSHPRLDLFVGSLSPHPRAEFGCTICHQGQGSATEFTFASHSPDNPDQGLRWRSQYNWWFNEHWDFPMRPQRFIQSSCLSCHHDVTDLEPSERFPDPPAARVVAGYNLVRTLGCFGCHEIKGVTESGERTGPDMRLEPASPEKADAGAAGEDPLRGTMRKVGPSLGRIAGKLDATFMESWIANPTGFRAETRMPQFFGMHEHLGGQSLADARRFEAVEIRAISEYLLASSSPVELIEPRPGVTEPPSVVRGRRLFEVQGCLACHKHADFPQGQSTFAPNLTNLGSKLHGEAGARWLVNWLRDPAGYSPHTLMPNPLLEPTPLAGAAEGEGLRITDPAADIAAYLLASADWQADQRPPLVETNLDELALMHLTETLGKQEAEEYLREGIPRSMAEQVLPDASELVGPMTTQKKLRYVGRRTIAKRGCFGCHDIPGFEDAQPIGPALSDWGRKDESLLAFEQVGEFIARERAPADDDRAFFEAALLNHRREGFIWQKLRVPRSFDYKQTENKGYNERLTMGRFSLSDDQREQIITFVLGLVDQPPAAKYVHRPDRRRRAIVEGRRVLDRYGCGQCHTLAMERWAFEYDPDEYQPPPSLPDFDFLEPPITRQQVAASTTTDRRGMAHAEVVGMPRVDASGELIEDLDDDDNPLYFFTLWEPAAINGEVARVGGADVLISRPQITARRPPLGGQFARLLFPRAVEEARASGSTATEMEAWGRLPPPLVDEGRKVQLDWLYDYLRQPYRIRPAALLRMPKFNMSPSEVAALVDYFAAVARVAFPYSFHPSSLPPDTENVDPGTAKHMDNAMQLVTDRTTYCAKCHVIGDFTPAGESGSVLAPNLERVGRRIRADYLRRWLANPRSALPYTPMPVNFPPTGEPMGQDLLPGTSLEQLDAVGQLLLHYDWYMKRQTSVRAMIE